MAFQTGFEYLDDFELGNPLEPGICMVHGKKNIGKSRFTKEASIYNALLGTKVCYFFYADTVPEQMTEKQYLGKIAEELMEKEGAPTLFGMGQKAEEKYREELKEKAEEERNKINDLIIDLIKDKESGVSKKVLELKGQDIYESLLGDDSKIEEFGKEILGNIEVYNMRAMNVGAYEKHKLWEYFKEGGIVVIDPLSVITNV